MFLTAALMMLSTAAYAEKKKVPSEEVTFAVDLHCENCKKKCNANLPFEKGVLDFNVDLNSKTIYFKFDPRKTSKSKLAKAVEKLGYNPVEVKPAEISK